MVESQTTVSEVQVCLELALVPTATSALTHPCHRYGLRWSTFELSPKLGPCSAIARSGRRLPAALEESQDATPVTYPPILSRSNVGEVLVKAFQLLAAWEKGILLIAVYFCIR